MCVIMSSNFKTVFILHLVFLSRTKTNFIPRTVCCSHKDWCWWRRNKAEIATIRVTWPGPGTNGNAERYKQRKSLASHWLYNCCHIVVCVHSKKSKRARKAHARCRHTDNTLSHSLTYSLSLHLSLTHLLSRTLTPSLFLPLFHLLSLSSSLIALPLSWVYTYGALSLPLSFFYLLFFTLYLFPSLV